MLKGLYRRGEENLNKARVLLVTAALGAIVPLLTTLNIKSGGKGGREPLVPDHSNVFDWLSALLPVAWTRPMLTAGGKTLMPSSYKLVFGHSVFAIGAGVLVGLRTSAWMVIGGLFLAIILTPMGLEWSWVNVNGDATLAVRGAGSAVSQLGPWVGAPMLVASGFVTFAWRWRSIARAVSQPFRKLSAASPASPTTKNDDAAITLDAIQVPTRWSLIGIGSSTLVLIVLAQLYFAIPPHLTLLAVAMTFLLASVASRVTGETDIAPVGPLGKVMQLTYGVLGPRSAIANVQSASITSGASIAAADLLNDVKTGHLLGADPRRQFIAQALGIIAGTIGTVIAFNILVPDATALGDGPQQFAAPAAKTWLLVAKVMTDGLANVHPMHRWLILGGSLVGATLMVIEKLSRAKLRRYVPSATGLGIGMVLSFEVALGMLVGAVAAEVLKRRAPQWSEHYLVIVAAGAIAGESIVSIFVYALNAMH